jgi:hypothetical protein
MENIKVGDKLRVLEEVKFLGAPPHLKNAIVWVREDTVYYYNNPCNRNKYKII